MDNADSAAIVGKPDPGAPVSVSAEGNKRTTSA